METTTTKLPPGHTGLPLLGETLTFLKDVFGFVEKGVAKYGPVFRTRILGRDVAIIAGPEACTRWLDPKLIERHGANLPHVVELFGGQSLPMLDGSEHRQRKQQVMAAFTREALTSYVPPLQSMLERAFAEWSGRRRVERDDQGGIAVLKQLAIEGICGSMFHLGPGAELDALLADYEAVTRSFSSLPIPLPGTAHSRGKKAIARILERYVDECRRHQASPMDDGLGRILAAMAEGGARITLEDAARELHHTVIAGVIIYGWFAWVLRTLAERADVREKLVEEVGRLAPSGAIALTELFGMPYLQRFTMEVKRTCPIVHVIFGRAKDDFELGGYTVPRGWTVLWAPWSTNLWRATYSQPERFDPERFTDERAEHRRHQHAFSPQGPGPDLGHRCAGFDYSTIFLQLFTVLAVRGYRWELPPQDLTLLRDRIPPEPRSGLRVAFHAA